MRGIGTRTLLAAGVAAVTMALGLPVVAVTPAHAVQPAQPAHAAQPAQPIKADDVDNFTFGDFVGEYTLSKDEEGRSALRVVETFTAEFPDFEQNKGAVRWIPRVYDGHTVSIEIESLTRGGEPEPIYDEDVEGDYLTVATGDDDYLTGDQTYELTYTLRDVTKSFDDHQEFYWDTVGNLTQQPFASVTAHVHFEGPVADAFTGDVRCFEGPKGSDTPCDFSQDGNTVTFTSNGPLGPQENVSMLMRFEAGTFEPFSEPEYYDTVRSVGPVVAIALPLIGLAWMVALWSKRGRSAKGRGTVIAEYLPPEGMTVLVAEAVLRSGGPALPAQLLDLAVRGNLRILERPGKKKRSKPKFFIEGLNLDGLQPEERKLINTLGAAKPGTTVDLSDISAKKSEALRGVAAESNKKLVFEQGYRRKVPRSRGILWYTILAAAVSICLFVLSVGVGSAPFALCVVIGMLVYAVTLVINYSMRPLTEKGALAKEHLQGLKTYIRLAEQDRIRVLQSPEGAEREPVDTGDHDSLVKLYESVLPYAVLFKQEKQWSKVIAIEYEESQLGSPSWYYGSSNFSTIGLGAALGSFTASANSAFAPPTSSSSSGFSSGGGYSGGGGGGGGFGGR